MLIFWEYNLPAPFYPNFLTLMCSLSRQSSLCICKASHIKIGNKDFRGRLTFPTLCISSSPEYVNFLLSTLSRSVIWDFFRFCENIVWWTIIHPPLILAYHCQSWTKGWNGGGLLKVIYSAYMHIVSSNINMFCFLMKVVWPMLWIYSHIKGGGGALSQLDQNINHWICFAWTQKSMQYIFANV